MRNAFSEVLIKQAKLDPNFILLTGDHGYALFDEFRKVCQEQYLNAGIAEQNMIGVAAGLAKTGFRPIIYGLSAFIPIRVLEQIKIDICYENLPVILIGDGAGLVYSALGTSHQSTEDISALRAIPNITILSPADEFEMRACFDYAYQKAEPVYIRIGKSDLGQIHKQNINLQAGKLIQITTNNNLPDLVFMATGSMVKIALDLSEIYTNSTVYSTPCIKPINKSQVLEISKQTKLIITLEEHSIYGGLGAVISEIVSESNLPVSVYRIGIQDRFSALCGDYNYLLREHKLDLESINQQIQSILSNLGNPAS